VQCLSGSVLDIVVDIRVGSPTFGAHVACELNSSTRQGLFVSEGLGHGFCALTEEASVGYLCSTPYTPGREHGINPLDPALDLPWPTDIPTVLSDKDRSAPSLDTAATQGLLPTLAACTTFARGLRS
jgi:dTDP-4-dehydrorhamnose 3,5-epimerase